MFKAGTPLSVFKTYTANLPDHGGPNFEIVGPTRQSYVTNLTQAEVDSRQKDAIIDVIHRDVQRPRYTQQSTNAKRADSPTNNRNLWRRDPSSVALNLLSKDPVNPQSEDFNSYLFHPSLGSGTTIYVLDMGIYFGHEELQNRGSGIRQTGWCVPNRLSGCDMPDNGPNALKDYNGWNPGLREYEGHGTPVASVAVGKNLGVASKANMVLVKNANGMSTNNALPAAPVELLTAYASAEEWCLESILQDVDQNDLQRKAVVLVTSTLNFEPDANTGKDPFEDVWDKFLTDCEANDIIVVYAMGNFGNKWYFGPSIPAVSQEYINNVQGTPWNRNLDVPGRLATDHPDMITVGGILSNGSLDYYTTPVIGHGEEPVTAYALSTGVRAAEGFSRSHGTELVDGTSFAAPIVAGLVSYILGLPDDKTHLANSVDFIQDVKQLIQSNAWQRVSDDKIITFPSDQLNYGNWAGDWVPDSLKAVYNGAWKE